MGEEVEPRLDWQRGRIIGGSGERGPTADPLDVGVRNDVEHDTQAQEGQPCNNGCRRPEQSGGNGVADDPNTGDDPLEIMV